MMILAYVDIIDDAPDICR